METMLIAGDRVKHQWDGATGTIISVHTTYVRLTWDTSSDHVFSADPSLLIPISDTVEILAPSPSIGATRACPDCGHPQHYTGHENGWAHDALIATWECADPARANAARAWIEHNREAGA